MSSILTGRHLRVTFARRDLDRLDEISPSNDGTIRETRSGNAETTENKVFNTEVMEARQVDCNAFVDEQHTSELIQVFRMYGLYDISEVVCLHELQAGNAAFDEGDISKLIDLFKLFGAHDFSSFLQLFQFHVPSIAVASENEYAASVEIVNEHIWESDPQAQDHTQDISELIHLFNRHRLNGIRDLIERFERLGIGNTGSQENEDPPLRNQADDNDETFASHQLSIRNIDEQDFAADFMKSVDANRDPDRNPHNPEQDQANELEERNATRISNERLREILEEAERRMRAEDETPHGNSPYKSNGTPSSSRGPYRCRECNVPLKGHRCPFRLKYRKETAAADRKLAARPRQVDENGKMKAAANNPAARPYQEAEEDDPKRAAQPSQSADTKDVKPAVQRVKVSIDGKDQKPSAKPHQDTSDFKVKADETSTEEDRPIKRLKIDEVSPEATTNMTATDTVNDVAPDDLQEESPAFFIKNETFEGLTPTEAVEEEAKMNDDRASAMSFEMVSQRPGDLHPEDDWTMLSNASAFQNADPDASTVSQVEITSVEDQDDLDYVFLKQPLDSAEIDDDSDVVSGSDLPLL